MMVRYVNWIVMLGMLVGWCGCTTPGYRRSSRKQLQGVEHWLCYYGSDRNVLSTPGLQMLILDPDAIGPVDAADKQGRLLIGYLSLGEAEEFRDYWEEIAEEDWVLFENPNWKADHLIDPRSSAWRKLVVKTIARHISDFGYDGFMLDTLDTAEMLLELDQTGFAGVREGMADIIQALRRKFPDKIIIANRGLQIIPLAAEALDGVLVEDVRSMYDFKQKASRRLTPHEQEWIDNQLLNISLLGLPVFALDYVDPPDPPLANAVFAELKQAGFHPFISTVDLMHYNPPYIWYGQ